MLARLEREKLLQDQSSEIRNLGFIMSLFISLASEMRDASLLSDDGEEAVKKSSPRFKFNPSDFDAYIVAYANKFGITLRGPDDIDEMVADLDTDAKLPASGEDPWGWNDALKSYSKNYATKPPVGGGKAGIGGDSLDITSWSSAQRAQYVSSSFQLSPDLETWPIGSSALDGSQVVTDKKILTRGITGTVLVRKTR